MGTLNGSRDSRENQGGSIPGTPGVHAYSLSGPEPSTIPLLISVPHAGRAYPGTLMRALRDPQATAMKLEDRYVDRIGLAVARETGAQLLVANAPRAMIDLNRAPDDIDWDMFNRESRPESSGQPASRRVRSGLGLVPRRVPGIGELWKRNHEPAELTARIDEIHEPYHAALAGALADLHARWGTAFLLDLHSMPPIPARANARPPEFVVGDRFGASCHGRFVAAAFSHFQENDRIVAHNRPYSGGYVLQRHAAAHAGIHAIQIEIDRSVYLDANLQRPGGGFASTVRILTGLVRRIAAEIAFDWAGGGQPGWQDAAE